MDSKEPRSKYGFSMYPNYLKAIDDFTKGDDKAFGRYMRILAYYGIYGEDITENEVEKLFFTSVIASVDSSVEKRSNGATGGRKSKKTTPTPEEEKKPVSVSTATPSQVEYSKQVFELFKAAKLPCARNNEISFLQTDFKNALVFLHNSDTLHSYSSSEIIGAVKNYIKVLNDPDSYFTVKMNFFSLVKCKSFYNFLPANFDESNFKKYGAKESAEATESAYDVNPCPACKAKTLKYIQNKDVFHCDTCGQDVPFDEVMK